jgi:GT2 family glycosyltransferase
MTVSIIIAIKELNDNLKECLNHCFSLNYPDFEIIVFPDATFFFQNKRVRIIPTGDITPPQKRDFALKEAKGDILAFVDDDAYPNKFWLDKAIPNFEDKDVAAVVGPAITPPEDSLRQKASGAVYDSILVSGSHSLRYRPKARCFVDDYPSSNFLIRRSVFEELGGFKVAFWPGEDTFLCLGITKKLNKKIIYDPEVLVCHHRRPLFLPHLKQVANYAFHRGYFAKRFSQNSLKFSYFIPSIFLCFVFLGGIVAFFYHKFSYLYFLGAYIYLALVLIFSFSKDLRMVFLQFFGIISTHLTYGLFFLKGLFSHKLPEE